MCKRSKMLPQSFADFFSRTSRSRHFRKVQFLVQVWAFYARRRLRLTRSNFLLTPQYLRRPLSLLRFQSRWQKLWGLVTVWDNFIYFIKPSLVTPQDALFSARGNRVVRTSRGEVYRGSGTNNLSWTPLQTNRSPTRLALVKASYFPAGETHAPKR